ncbi:hypothetical protein CLF_111640 [Clonorchis sinensis]|uniref:Uncharacterized protein n=1 Tax=Clonorchis sinensis TaxID=79923 RepID=G7YV58_CLOSI|nr:hypothetical protein CLF_111640 [Clonorchis sinensis]
MGLFKIRGQHFAAFPDEEAISFVCVCTTFKLDLYIFRILAQRPFSHWIAGWFLVLLAVKAHTITLRILMLLCNVFAQRSSQSKLTDTRSSFPVADAQMRKRLKPSCFGRKYVNTGPLDV